VSVFLIYLSTFSSHRSSLRIPERSWAVVDWPSSLMVGFQWLIRWGQLHSQYGCQHPRDIAGWDLRTLDDWPWARLGCSKWLNGGESLPASHSLRTKPRGLLGKVRWPCQVRNGSTAYSDLTISLKLGIRTMFASFDDCWVLRLSLALNRNP
jgi:hypothetical protein